MECPFNSKAMNSFIPGLPELNVVKVMDSTTTKDLWDNKSSYYEGKKKFKSSQHSRF